MNKSEMVPVNVVKMGINYALWVAKALIKCIRTCKVKHILEHEPITECFRKCIIDREDFKELEDLLNHCEDDDLYDYALCILEHLREKV